MWRRIKPVVAVHSADVQIHPSVSSSYTSSHVFSPQSSLQVFGKSAMYVIFREQMSSVGILLIFILLMMSMKGLSCDVYEINGTALDFTRPASVTQHTIQKGYQKIQCEAKNFCRIQWYKESVPYPWIVSQYTQVALEDNNQTLRFQSAYHDANGNYTCVISNETHSMYRSTKLDVDAPFWDSKPLQIKGDAEEHNLCYNQTATIGENRTFACSFYVGMYNFDFAEIYFLKLNNSSPANETQWQFPEPIPDTFTEYEEDSFTAKTGNVTLIGRRLKILDISDDAYGVYMVRASITGHFKQVFLQLYPPESPRPEFLERYGIGSAVSFLSLLMVLFVLWKMVALDVKLFYMDHFGIDEQNDNRMYDAYISYGWNDDDREFVLKILMPYLEKFGYKLFIPEIHTIPSNVLLEELSRAMSSSRRCIMLITPRYNTSKYIQYEIQHVTDVMSSKLSQRIIPIFLGVSPFQDPSPLTCPSPPKSLASPSSLSTSSLSSQSDLDGSSTAVSSNTSQDFSSISSSSSSEISSPSKSSSSSKPVKMDFSFCPLLGQLIPVLKPLKSARKKCDKVCNYRRFLKKLRLRMPKPPLRNMKGHMPLEMVTVAHTRTLVNNEVLPEQYEAEDRYVNRTIPRLCEEEPITNPTSVKRLDQEWQGRLSAANIGRLARPVVPTLDPTSATNFHQEPCERSAATFNGFMSAVQNDTSLASTYLGS